MLFVPTRNNRSNAKWWAKPPAHPTFDGFCYHQKPFTGLNPFVMSRYRRADVPGATYFFTAVTYRRRPILCDAQVCTALRDAVKTVQSRYAFTL